MSALDPPGSKTVNEIYATLDENIKAVREKLGGNDVALTLAEKIVYGHLDDVRGGDAPTRRRRRGRSYRTRISARWRRRRRRCRRRRRSSCWRR